MRRRKAFYIAFICGFLTCAVLAGVAAVSLHYFSGKEAAIRNLIRKYYRDEVTDDAITEGKYRGMIAATEDKYSAYYTKDEYAEMTTETRVGNEDIYDYASYAVIRDTRPAAAPAAYAAKRRASFSGTALRRIYSPARVPKAMPMLSSLSTRSTTN